MSCPNSLALLAPRGIVLALLCAPILALLAGCAVPTRPSVPPGPPIDLKRQIDERALERLLSEELQIRRPTEYLLGPGDVINVQLVGRPDVLSSGPQGQERGVEITLSESSMISLPLIGAISVHGKTAGQLQEDLERAYSQFIRDPQPLVLVTFYNRNQVTVIGSVVESGKVPLEFGDTLLDAIFKAGGLSPGGRGGGLAPGRTLKIYREKVSHEQRMEMTMDELIEAITTREGVVPREEIVVPIEDLIFEGKLQYNLPLAPNDIVYVPPAGTASVIGRVGGPGVAFLGPSVSSTTQVLTEMGGMRFSADSRIHVVRPAGDGTFVTYTINGRRMLSRREPDFYIHDGDQLFVFGTRLRAVGEWLGDLFNASIRTGANATYSPMGP